MAMISRRHFFRVLGGLGAFGVSPVAYGFAEPALQLRVTRYNLAPQQWPADFKLNIAVIADLHACDPWMSLERIHGIVEGPIRSTRISSSCSATTWPGIAR